MSTDMRLQQLGALGERALEAFKKRSEKLDVLRRTKEEKEKKKKKEKKGAPEKCLNRLTASIYAEASVHLQAMAATFMYVHKTLTGLISIDEKKTESPLPKGTDKWLVEYDKEVKDTSQGTDKLIWDFTFGALEDCVKVAEISQIKEILELLLVIADKTSTLWGAEYVKLLFELVNAIREGQHIWALQEADTRTAVNVLNELELFMVLSLAASEYAVASAHRFMQDITKSQLSPKEQKILRDYARAFVVEKIRNARTELALWVQFPKDGFWLDAPQFRH